MGREEVKLSLFADDMILYLEPQRVYQKLVELITELSKVTRYKINIQKLFALLTQIKLSEREIKKIPFIIASKIPRNKFNRVGKRCVLRKL